MRGSAKLALGREGRSLSSCCFAAGRLPPRLLGFVYVWAWLGLLARVLGSLAEDDAARRQRVRKGCCASRLGRRGRWSASMHRLGWTHGPIDKSGCRRLIGRSSASRLRTSTIVILDRLVWNKRQAVIP